MMEAVGPPVQILTVTTQSHVRIGESSGKLKCGSSVLRGVSSSSVPVSLRSPTESSDASSMLNADRWRFARFMRLASRYAEAGCGSTVPDVHGTFRSAAARRWVGRIGRVLEPALAEAILAKAPCRRRRPERCMHARRASSWQRRRGTTCSRRRRKRPCYSCPIGPRRLRARCARSDAAWRRMDGRLDGSSGVSGAGAATVTCSSCWRDVGWPFETTAGSSMPTCTAGASGNCLVRHTPVRSSFYRRQMTKASWCPKIASTRR